MTIKRNNKIDRQKDKIIPFHMLVRLWTLSLITSMVLLSLDSTDKYIKTVWIWEYFLSFFNSDVFKHNYENQSYRF